MLIKLELSLQDLAHIFAACDVVVALPNNSSRIPHEVVEQYKRDLRRIMQDLIAAEEKALKAEGVCR
jgi:hypothetical protein